MSMSIPSIPFFVLDIPTVKDLSGTFKYFYFTKRESLDDAATEFIDGKENPQITKSRYGLPRKVIINLSDCLMDLLPPAGARISESTVVQILTANNLLKAEAESQLQSRNGTRVTFEAKQDFLESLYNHPDFDSSNDHYEAALKLLGNLDETTGDLMTRILENTKIPGPINIDPTTNKPVITFDEVASNAQSTSTIMDSFLGDLISSVVDDTLSPFSDDFYAFETSAHDMQSDSRQQYMDNFINLNDYALSIEEIEIGNSGILGQDLSAELSTPGVEPIAFIVYKTRVEGNKRTPETPIIITSKTATTVTDSFVKYGAVYEYSVHTLALCSGHPAVPLEGIDQSLKHFLVISNRSKKISITCTEKNPPKTVSDINFYFLSSSMILMWNLPNQTNEQLVPVNDIKYIQIFVRNSIREPFRLFRFNQRRFKYRFFCYLFEFFKCRT